MRYTPLYFYSIQVALDALCSKVEDLVRDTISTPEARVNSQPLMPYPRF